MRKILVSVFLLASLSSVNAQVVRVGLLGFGAGGGSKNAGLTMHILDINYAPQPRLDFGIYSNLGVGASANENAEAGSASGGFGLGVQSKFYLLTGKLKPFVGLQVGPRFGGSAKFNADGVTDDSKAGVQFQVVPQLGLRLGPLNLWGSYANKAVQINGGFVFGFGKFDE